MSPYPIRLYVVIFSENDGLSWRASGGAFEDSEDALRYLRVQKAAHPDAAFEMHSIGDHLYAALRLSWAAVENVS